MSQAVGPHQRLSMPLPCSWTSNPQNCDKEMSIVYKSHCLWHFCYSSWRRLIHHLMSSNPLILISRQSSSWHCGWVPALFCHQLEAVGKAAMLVSR